MGIAEFQGTLAFEAGSVLSGVENSTIRGIDCTIQFNADLTVEGTVGFTVNAATTIEGPGSASSVSFHKYQRHHLFLILIFSCRSHRWRIYFLRGVGRSHWFRCSLGRFHLHVCRHRDLCIPFCEKHHGHSVCPSNWRLYCHRSRIPVQDCGRRCPARPLWVLLGRHRGERWKLYQLSKPSTFRADLLR
jgi:hypothetical protein